MTDKEQLRYVWKDRVERLLGIEGYYVARTYDTHFARGATLVDRNGIDPYEYVDLIVRYGIRRNKILYPTLLSGALALSRYREQLEFEDRAVATYLMSFDSQCEAMRDLMEDMKLQDVLQMKALDFDPLVKIFFYFEEGLTAPDELISLGVQELDHKRGLKQVLDQTFVRRLLGG